MNAKAASPGVRRAHAALVCAVALAGAAALAGCGDFWRPPGSTGTGTTATTTTLTPSTTTPTEGVSVTLTASVSPSAATGTVTFYDGTTSIGSATLSGGTASTTVTFSTTGAQSLTATYGGSSSYASSTSSAVTVTVSAAADSGSSFAGAFGTANSGRRTNVVTGAGSTWTVTATSHVENISGVTVDGDTIQNIEGDGHCVYYAGSVFPAAGKANATGVYTLSGGGFLAPEGTKGLDCE